jgi:hypothetical protein
MELQFLKRFENKPCRIILKNNFVYNKVIFRINSDGLLEFSDRDGDLVFVEPSSVTMISGAGNGN